MAAALRLLIGRAPAAYVWLRAPCGPAEIFISLRSLRSVLKWLTLSLFAYVGAALVVDMPWLTVAKNLVLPISP